MNFKSNVYDCPSELYLCDKDAITVDNLTLLETAFEMHPEWQRPPL